MIEWKGLLEVEMLCWNTNYNSIDVVGRETFVYNNYKEYVDICKKYQDKVSFVINGLLDNRPLLKFDILNIVNSDKCNKDTMFYIVKDGEKIGYLDSQLLEDFNVIEDVKCFYSRDVQAKMKYDFTGQTISYIELLEQTLKETLKTNRDLTSQKKFYKQKLKEIRFILDEE